MELSDGASSFQIFPPRERCRWITGAFQSDTDHGQVLWDLLWMCHFICLNLFTLFDEAPPCSQTWSDGWTKRKERRTIYFTWLEFLNPGLSVGYFAHFGNERLVEETVPTPLASYLLMRREPAVLEPMRFPRDTVQLVGKLITSKQIAIIHRFVSLQRTNERTNEREEPESRALTFSKTFELIPGFNGWPSLRIYWFRKLLQS